MQIIADKDGIQAIKALCDIALRHSGIENLNGVNMVLQSLEEKQEETNGSHNAK